MERPASPEVYLHDTGLPHTVETFTRWILMEKIREIAIACIGRAVMFGSLAIACVMIGFSFSPVSAFRSGALLTLMMSMVLIAKAATAHRKNPKYTEVWLYLDETSRPSDARAQLIFHAIMREVYARFAWVVFLTACGLFGISLLFLLLGFVPYTPR